MGWQVFGRTAGEGIAASWWSFDTEMGVATIMDVEKWHKYTVRTYN
jgi:hypothetical protein